MRKKTYFSLYNKIERKNSYQISDSIGVRIVFNNLEDLYKFTDVFENKFVKTSKKDYILNPKENGYRSIHYKYAHPYQNTEIMVELQLRTTAMNNAINNNNEISHYSYTIKENKWAPLFTEVHEGYKYMLESIKTIKK